MVAALFGMLVGIVICQCNGTVLCHGIVREEFAIVINLHLGVGGIGVDTCRAVGSSLALDTDMELPAYGEALLLHIVAKERCKTVDILLVVRHKTTGGLKVDAIHRIFTQDIKPVYNPSVMPAVPISRMSFLVFRQIFGLDHQCHF